MVSDRLAQINKIVDDERREGYNDAIAKGRQIAERILLWFTTNEDLKFPHPIAKLAEWSRKAIDELRYKE